MLACIPAILISIILCIYAKKDIRDHIIPYNWWIAGVIPAVLGIALVIAEPTPFIVLRTQITVSICILLFALGFVRLLNGADAVFMIFVLLAFLPLSLGFIPIGVICLAVAPGCALMMAILNKTDRIPFIFPLAITSGCAVISVLIQLF